MIDYIRLRIPKTVLPSIMKKLSGPVEVKLSDKGDGEVLIEKYKLDNFDIIVYRPYTIISGSIHTFHNRITGRSEDNRDDFTHDELRFAIETLENRLGIEIKDYPLVQLEIGVNLRVNFNAKSFLRQNVLTWKFERAIVDEDKGVRGHLKEYKTSQFYVKMYDKGNQLELSYEELRLELKIIRSPYLRSHGITSLSDLLDMAKFKNLAEELFNKFRDNLLVVDTVDVSFIENQKDMKLLMNGMNYAYWERLSTEPSMSSKNNKSVHPTTVFRRKQKFLRLLDVYNLTTGKSTLMALLRDKIYELSGVDVMLKQKVHNVSLITR